MLKIYDTIAMRYIRTMTTNFFQRNAYSFAVHARQLAKGQYGRNSGQPFNYGKRHIDSYLRLFCRTSAVFAILYDTI